MAMLTSRHVAQAVYATRFPLVLDVGWAKKHLNSSGLTAQLVREWNRRKWALAMMCACATVFGVWCVMHILDRFGLVGMPAAPRPFITAFNFAGTAGAWTGLLLSWMFYALAIDPWQANELKKAKVYLRALDTFLKAFDVPSLEWLPQDDEWLRAFVESRLLQQAGRKLAAELRVQPTIAARFSDEAQQVQKRLKHMYETAQPFDLVPEQPLAAYEERALRLLAENRSVVTGLARPSTAAATTG